MKIKRKRFNTERSAKSFAKKVNGNVNDLRQVKNAKSYFTVTYKPTKNTKQYASNNSDRWSPEDNRDFGYPNDYWK